MTIIERTEDEFGTQKSIDSRFIESLADLFERNETGRVGSTDTGATVLHRLVSDGKLAEVVTNHLGLDFNLGLIQSIFTFYVTKMSSTFRAFCHCY